MAEAPEHDELFRLAGMRVEGPAFLGRHEAVVVGGDKQHWARCDLSTTHSGLNPSVSSMYSSGIRLIAPGTRRRAAAASSADWRSGSRISLRWTNSDWPVSARLMRSAAARSSRS